jgi:nucleoside-diphosphate-sugar epimerase
MKIFVTGGTGFIGSHFINTSIQAGHKVVALKRPKSVPRISLNREPLWVEGDLDGDFKKEMRGCDVLVHLAAHSPNPPYDTLDQCLYWNLIASLNLLHQAHDMGIKKFLIAGTCFEYGRAGERYDYIPIDAPLEPTMSYSTSKAAASVALHGWAIENQIKLQILRIFQVFGEGEPQSRLWPSLREAALLGNDYPMTRGGQVRDFISVEEVATAFVQALDFDGVESGNPLIKHIGTGKPQTVLEFSEYWWKHWGAKGKLLPGVIPYRENEVMRFVPVIKD